MAIPTAPSRPTFGVPQPPPPPAAPSLVSPAFPHGIPRFAKDYTLQSAKNGRWSDARNWWPQRVPRDGDVLSITHVITIDGPTARIPALEVFGTLIHWTSTLQVGTLMVYPGGALYLGDETAPASSEIVILDQPLDTTFDPEQFGTGMISVGAVMGCGATRTPFVRATAEIPAGTTQLPIPVTDWQAGDRVFLPDTRQLQDTNTYVPQWEVLTLADGAGRLTTPTTFAHKGARDQDGQITFLPHVVNLTRSVTIRSEHPAGTRGHVLFAHEAEIDLCHVQFRDMGRTLVSALDSTTWSGNTVTHVGTNQIGRYPLHCHHLIGMPGAHGQFNLEGCVIDGGRKWGIAIHASHKGTVSGNVVHDVAGAGIVTEDGLETENVIDGNFVGRVSGSGGTGIERGTKDLAWEGAGFHFRGSNNYVRNNVAVNCLNSYGFKLFQHSASKAIVSVPILEFSGNEAYGASEGGLTYWWIGTLSNTPIANMPESVIRDTRIWHITHTDILHYPSNHLTIDGLVIRGNLAVNRETTAWMGGDYFAKDTLLTHCDIQGRSIGWYPSTNGGPQELRESLIRCKMPITLRTLWTSASDVSFKNIPPRVLTLRRVRTGTPALKQLERVYTTQDGRNVVQIDSMTLDDFNGLSGRGYWAQQVASYVVPPSRLRPNGIDFAFYGSPQGTKVSGELAPCTTVKPGVDGLVCP